MNNIVVSLIGIFFLIVIFSLIGNFFNINPLYYVPFMLWGIMLFIFNAILEKKHINKFMKEIKNN